MSSSDARLARIEDRTAIIEHIHSYCRVADQKDHEGMLSHFIDDCRVNYVVGQPDMEGKEALRAMLVEYLPNTVSSQHMITNEEVIFVTDDEVILHTFMYSWQRYVDYPTRSDTHRFGRYECRLIRDGDGWLFTHMYLVSAGELGDPRIGEQFDRPWPPVFS